MSHSPNQFEPWATTLQIVDKECQAPRSMSLSTKAVDGAGGYAVKEVCSFVRRQAYLRAVLKTDGEPTTVELHGAQGQGDSVGGRSH